MTASPRGVFRLSWWTIGAALVWVSPAPAEGQEPPDSTDTFTLAGEVVDGTTRAPIPFAFIELLSDGKRVLSDSAGAFVIPGLRPGYHRFRLSQLGYITLEEATEILPGDVLSATLTPKPITLEGIRVTVDRLESRRRSAAFSVREMGPEEIHMSSAMDAGELVERMPGVFISPCGIDDCVLSRGRYQTLRVVLDEFPAYGGLVQLASFPTSAIHSVEYISTCAMVRIYTKWFIERLARGGGGLGPVLCEYR